MTITKTTEYKTLIVPKVLRLHAIDKMMEEGIEYKLLSFEEIPDDFVFSCVFAGQEYGANINYFMVKCEPQEMLDYLYEKRGRIYEEIRKDRASAK